jgi:ABC-type cobalamin transport system ATPase subunit
MKTAKGSFEVTVQPLSNADVSDDALFGRFLLSKKFSGDLIGEVVHALVWKVPAQPVNRELEAVHRFLQLQADDAGRCEVYRIAIRPGRLPDDDGAEPRI